MQPCAPLKNETELLKAAKNGSVDARNQLLENDIYYIKWFLSQKFPSDCKELFAVSVESYIASIPRFNSARNVKWRTFVMKSIYFYCLRELRSGTLIRLTQYQQDNKPRFMCLSKKLTDPFFSKEQNKCEWSELLRVTISKLEPGHRQTVKLILQGLTCEEIADTFGWSPIYMHRHWKEIKTAMRNIMAPEMHIRKTPNGVPSEEHILNAYSETKTTTMIAKSLNVTTTGLSHMLDEMGLTINDQKIMVQGWNVGRSHKKTTLTSTEQREMNRREILGRLDIPATANCILLVASQHGQSMTVDELAKQIALRKFGISKIPTSHQSIKRWVNWLVKHKLLKTQGQRKSLTISVNKQQLSMAG